MTCRLCQNHGVLARLRGHKYNCPYRECNCFNCKTTGMRKAEARQSRAKGKRGYQLDENSEVLQLMENRANNVESKFENQTVVAWINGEEIQDETLGEEVFIF